MSPSIATNPGVASSGFGTRVVRATRALIRAWAHRRQVHGLLALDDRALKDIGLVRSDVTGALDLPFDRDPSTLLVVRSVERRARMRAEHDAARRAKSVSGAVA